PVRHHVPLSAAVRLRCGRRRAAAVGSLPHAVFQQRGSVRHRRDRPRLHVVAAARLHRRRQPQRSDGRPVLRSLAVRAAGEQHRTIRQLFRRHAHRSRDARLLDDDRKKRGARVAVEGAGRGGVLESVQHGESRRARHAEHHVRQLRPDHADAAGRSGGTAHRAVLAALFLLSAIVPAAPDRARQRRWDAATATVLLVGYAGYYVCRSNLSVVAPQLLAEFGPRGFDKAALGVVSSAGVLAYAGGKALNGGAGGLFGGRRMFLAGMAGSIAATLAFGASGTFAAFVAIWSVNRFVQSAGWSALVKIASQWYAPERYGSIMGVLSLSFLFGDAAGRLWLGALVGGGVGWRGVFVASAATLGVIAIVCAIS